MVQSVIEKLQQLDPEVGDAVAAELQREKRGLELIASENIISEGVMLAMATPPANKYAEGYPGRRYYGGCECVDAVSYTQLLQPPFPVHEGDILREG